MPKDKTPNFFRRRTAWNGFLPIEDDGGNWLQLRWLWWSWDYFPDPVSDSLGRQVDYMRGADES